MPCCCCVILEAANESPQFQSARPPLSTTPYFRAPKSLPANRTELNRLVHWSMPWLRRRVRSRPDPNAPTHHDRDVVASRRSASRGAWGFPSGAQGSGPPTHPHASCDNAYALTVRIRSKLPLPPIVSSSIRVAHGINSHRKSETAFAKIATLFTKKSRALL